ncbi:hypothetical protein [Noviherbaspirillum pedocola]|uniref:Uncharacterized protein n=1 Tax=Noviherbaspirillum pedocola TaxID=2801341 RepID=A0A934W966_9BURK|nr:hypothetical protein [Noviherbaspirillum pedocola]MBK4738445.1 hypothetical protein [Noviherbaspirillum pedocola]
MTGEYNGISAAYERYRIKQEIEEISNRLGQNGRNVPEVPKAWVNGGQLVDDYSPAQLERFRTIDNLEALRKQGIVELDANWSIKSVASGREMFINPRQVRFTQEWVNYNSSDKINTLDTTGRTVQVSPENLPAMDVVLMPDGRLTSLDNRRLTASYLYEAENVKVIIRAGNDPLPDARTVERFSWKGYVPQTWADAAAVRIFKQGPEFRETFRQGSPVVPLVKNAPSDPFYRPYLAPPTRRR